MEGEILKLVTQILKIHCKLIKKLILKRVFPNTIAKHKGKSETYIGSQVKILKLNNRLKMIVKTMNLLYLEGL
jgi:hypothetical protein